MIKDSIKDNSESSSSFATIVAEFIGNFGKEILNSRTDDIWEKIEAHTSPLLKDKHDVETKANILKTKTGLYSSTDSTYCPHQSYFEVLPARVSQVSTSAPTSTWQGDGCFTSMSATATFSSSGASVTLTGSNPTTLLCSDVYVVTTAYSFAVADVSSLSGSAVATFKSWDTTTQEATDVSLNGLRIYVLPCGLLGSITSILKTASLFTNTNTTSLEESNIDFLTSRGVWPAVTQVYNKTVPFTALKNAVRSGDYISVARFDGLDPVIAFGIGGRTGHSAVAVWEGDELYILESTDVNPFGKVYWPPPYGIIKHEFTAWMTLASSATYHVAVLPLAKQYADAFNETAFWNWYNTVQGMPYGYHTFLYSFLDTFGPQGNLPMPVDDNIPSVIFHQLEQFMKNSTYGTSIFSILTWGMNHRLNTNCATLACNIDVLVNNQLNNRPVKTFMQAAAIPDNDAWKFGANYSMVCSEFAHHAWKAGLSGAFPVFSQIMANEQTPKDNYQMGIYDTVGRFDETSCPGGLTQGDENGVGTYCQVMGTYQLLLNGYNNYGPYANQNNNCNCQWPSYSRSPSNC